MLSDENLLREVVGDDKNDDKRKTNLNELNELNEEEWILQQRTGGGAES